MGSHGPAAEIDVRQVLVVSATEKGDRVHGVVAAQAEGVAMVVLTRRDKPARCKG